MPNKLKEKCLKGIPISGGVAYSKSCMMGNTVIKAKVLMAINEADVPKEISRVKDAIVQIIQKLERLIPSINEKVGVSEANIFNAIKMMIEDNSLQQKLFKTIEAEVVCAEKAVISVFEKYEKRLASADNDYIRERATDLRDLKQHLLKELGSVNTIFKCEGLQKCTKGHKRIIITHELTPSITATFDLYHTRGFISEIGGQNSHAAILARGMGVPAVSNIKNATRKIFCGSEILVDGDEGLVYINPSDATLAKYKHRNEKQEKAVIEPVKGLKVLANISQVSEAELAAKYKAEGIGLYRSEIEFIAQNVHLTEDQQFQIYSDIIANMPGKDLYFRMLDIGGDKPLPFVNIPTEENPALGLRGSRFLIYFKEFMRNQARAIARASLLAPVGVMYPMISSLEQFLMLKNLFNENTADIECGQITHGVLFEIPAACIMADEILAQADFGSIGTNDLIQYLMAVDRSNELVSQEYNVHSPALWSVIKIVADAANKYNKPLSVCGELAGQVDHLQKFMDIGITTLSVNPHSISSVRAAANEILTK